jgi:hypothetical protein
LSFDFTTPTEEEETEQNVEEDDEEEEEEEIGTGPWLVKGTRIRQSPCFVVRIGA